MIRKIHLFIALVLVLLLSSCSTIRTVSFERLQAAKVSFPEQIRRIGVINFVPKATENLENADSSLEALVGDGKVASETFAQEIAETGYFDQVIICDSALNGISTLTSQQGMFPSKIVDGLIDNLDVDILFVLEKVDVQLMKGSMFAPDLMIFVPSVEAAVTPLVGVYSKGRDNAMFTVSKSDTICWEIIPELTYDQILKDASEYAGTMPVKHLLPYWNVVERSYFDGGYVGMRDAGVYVREGEWSNAAALWETIYQKKKGKLKMRAAFNLALYYEMQEDYAKAKKYLDPAQWGDKNNSMERTMIDVYWSQLNELEAQMLKLKLQMDRFKNVF